MTAYLIGHIKVRDEGLWQEYIAGVAESLSSFEARVVFRGTLVETLAGVHGFDRTVVMEFPDKATVDAWYGSAGYQSLIPLRERAADVAITVYET